MQDIAQGYVLVVILEYNVLTCLKDIPFVKITALVI